MANEAVIIELLGNPPGEPIQFTVADGTQISGGTLLNLTDPRTATKGGTTNYEVFCGIAAAEKVANDGSTTLAVYTNGIFDLKAVTAGGDGAISVGDLVEMSGANTIRRLSGAFTNYQSGARVTVGRALETASDAEVIAVRINTL